MVLLVCVWWLGGYFYNTRWNDGPGTLRDPVPLAFRGRVKYINGSRGLQVKLDADPRWFYLSGACNSSDCLIDALKVGDTLSKDSGSAVIHLVRQGVASDWYLNWEDTIAAKTR